MTIDQVLERRIVTVLFADLVGTSDLGRGTHTLIGARLDLALGEPGASRSAAASAAVTFRGIPAPWWIAKAQRVLEAAGGADPQGTAEAQAIERSLGVSGGIS